jgi:CheY-like chemotaxis protein
MAKVLVIDDESDLRTLIGAMLEQKGIDIEEAGDGREGLLKARQNPPDLILCDLTMPVMGGMETLAECRRDATLRSVPFLMVTGSTQWAEEADLVQAGAVGVLLKPFTPSSLLETVSTHLGGATGDEPAASA